MDSHTAALLQLAGGYAGAVALFGVALTMLVIRMRRAKQIGIGDGGDKALARLVRAHGNFVETAALMLPLLALLALTGGPGWLIHAVGLLFVGGRLLHAVGLARSAGASAGRLVGMMLTFAALLIASLALIARGIGLP